MNEEERIESLKLALNLVQKVSIGPYETADCSIHVSGITIYSTAEEIAALVDQGKVAYAHMATRVAAMIADAKRERGWGATSIFDDGDVPFDNEPLSAPVRPEYAQTANGAAVQAPPRPPANPDAPVCPNCQGPMEMKRGTSKKNGKPWAGYFCINNKGATGNAAHTPIWV